MGQFRELRGTVARSLVAFAFLGCSGSQSSGGQSGTDGDDESCPYDDGEAIELDQPWSGLTTAERVALLNTQWDVKHVRTFIDGDFVEVSEPVEIPLELSLDVNGAILYHSERINQECSMGPDFVALDAGIHLTLGDSFDFTASEPIPPGWRRAFQLMADGAWYYHEFCWDPETHTAAPMVDSCEAGVESGILRFGLSHEPGPGLGSYVLDELTLTMSSSVRHYYPASWAPVDPEPVDPEPMAPPP